MLERLFQGLSGTPLYWVVMPGLAVMGTAVVARQLLDNRRATAAAVGTVVGLAEERDSDGQTLYRAVVVFTSDGVEHRCTDPMASRPAAHRVGDQVTVYYPPGDPGQARIGRWRYVQPFLAIAVVGWGGVIAGVLWHL